MIGQNQNLKVFPIMYPPQLLPFIGMDQIKFQEYENIREVKKPFLQAQVTIRKFSESQIKQIVELYLQYGSRWSIFAEKIKGKQEILYTRSSKQIKNFFYNRLRKLAKNLCAAQKTKKLCQKKTITVMNLHCLLDTSLMVRKYSKVQTQDLTIFKIQRQVLDYSFFNDSNPIQQQKLLRLAKNVRQLKLLLKNIKIKKPFLSKFKVRKLSQKFLCQKNGQKIKVQSAKQQENNSQSFQIKEEQIQNLVAFLKQHEQKVKKQQVE